MADDSCSTPRRGKSSAARKPDIREVAVIATVKKSGDDVYRVRVIEINGREFADLRVFYPNRDGELRPTATPSAEVPPTVPAKLAVTKRSTLQNSWA